jgi:hypothetical protein
MPGTIVLAGCPIYPPEKIGAAAITPGHLLEVVPSGGDAGQLRLHATASGDAGRFFALESLVPSLANSQTAAIDLAYADGDSVRWAIAQPGDLIYGWVPASATAIKDGDELTSNGDGTLKKYAAQAANEGGTATYTIQVTCVVGRAAEDKDNSGGGSPARIRVRVV